MNTLTTRTLTIIISLTLLPFLTAKASSEHQSSPTVDSIIHVLTSISESDLTGSAVLKKTAELSLCYPEGTDERTVIDIFSYQAFSFLNNHDSATVYADRISKHIDRLDYQLMKIIYYNTSGMNAMVYELNYAVALNWFEKCLETALRMDNKCYAVVPLSNICNIFYIQKDSAGLQYAKHAYDIMSYDVTNAEEGYYKALSRITMSQMSLLASDLQAADRYIAESKSIISQFGLNCYNTQVAIVDADMKLRKGDINGAIECFKSGSGFIAYATSYTKALFYLRYGNTLEIAGQYENALSQYDNGLLMLGKTHSLEFKPDLLSSRSDILLKMNRYKESAITGTKYRALMERIVSIKEKEFEKEIRARTSAQNKNTILQQELMINKMHKSLLIMALVFAVLSAIMVSLWLRYKKHLKLYKVAVQKITLTTSSNNDGDATIKDVYARIEKLMENGFYKRKDLTLDMLASQIGTNRTYASKAINRYTGLTFWAFVDSYRVSHALTELENAGNDIVLKDLADEVGYSSASAFSRAFSKSMGMTPSKYRSEHIKTASTLAKL